MNRHIAKTAIWLTDLYIAYVFFERRQYDFLEEHYGENFLEHMFETQSRIFSQYDLKKLKGLSQTDNTFTDNPIKHRAFNFLLAECYPDSGEIGQNTRNVILKRVQQGEIETIEPLEDCSAFLFFLSVCYRNFHVFAKELNSRNNATTTEAYQKLEGIRSFVLMRTQSVIDKFWDLLKMKQWSSRGGKVQKSSEDIFDATSEVLQEKPENWSALQVWDHLRRNAEKHDLKFEKDYSGFGKDALVDLDGKRVRFPTFRRYVSNVKKTIEK